MYKEDEVRAQPSVVRLVNIRKSYVTGPVTTDILHGVDLEVSRGDLLSIMGPSGCGKSTLMNIMGLLEPPTGGSYFLNGREIRAMGYDELSTIRNASIGFVFQSFCLLPRLEVWENVAIPLVYRGLNASVIRRRSLEMLDRVGMKDRASHKPRELSGGQQQRVAIARALAGEPEMVLADEPTGALDVDTGEEIMRLFIELNAKDHVTTVLITHDRKVAKKCRRHARILDGALHEETLSRKPMPAVEQS